MGDQIAQSHWRFFPARTERVKKMQDLPSNNGGTAGVNWKRGAFRLWIVASVLWCAAVFSLEALTNKAARWFPAEPTMIHVKISNTVTWDYPAEWGVQRIRDDLQKRLAAEDEKDLEWAAQVPADRKEECNAIRPTIPFQNQPDDCNRLFFAKDRSVVPTGWEVQIETARDCKNGVSSCKLEEGDLSKSDFKPEPDSIVVAQGTIIQLGAASAWYILAMAAPLAIMPPFVVLVFGTSLFWAFAGFRRGSR